MPILKKYVTVRETPEGYQVEVKLGSQTMASWDIDADTTVQDFLFKNLGLRPGDRIDIDVVSEAEPVARVARPRPGAGKRKAAD